MSALQLEHKGLVQTEHGEAAQLSATHRTCRQIPPLARILPLAELTISSRGPQWVWSAWDWALHLFTDKQFSLALLHAHHPPKDPSF